MITAVIGFLAFPSFTSETCPDLPLIVVNDFRFPVILLFSVRMTTENMRSTMATTNPCPCIAAVLNRDLIVVDIVENDPFLLRNAGTV